MKIVASDKMKKAAVVVATAVLMGGATGLGVVSAQQGPTGGVRGGFAGAGMGALAVCSTTNYTDVAAKALGMDSTTLRQALVSGKTLQDIATGKSVSIDTVQQALQAARAADIAQAVKDGLITQDQADRMTGATQPQPSSSSDNNSNATPDATQPTTPGNSTTPANPGDPRRPGGPNGMRGLGVPDHNTVDALTVAAKALDMTCADLVKAMQTGKQSIAQVAAGKNIQAQTVVDALVAAYKGAIAEDVKEGLTAQAQADGETTNLINRAGLMVYSAAGERGAGGPGGMGGGFGGPGPMGGMGGGFGGQRGDGTGQPGQPNQPGQPGDQGNQQGGPNSQGGPGNAPQGDNGTQGSTQSGLSS